MTDISTKIKELNQLKEQGLLSQSQLDAAINQALGITADPDPSPKPIKNADTSLEILAGMTYRPMTEPIN